MKPKILIIALISPLLALGCDSKKVVTEKPAVSVEKITTRRPKMAEKKKQTPEEITADTEKVMDQMNDQASSGRYGLKEEAADADEATKAATRKLIEEAAKATTEDTEKAMQEAAKNALEATEKVGDSTPK